MRAKEIPARDLQPGDVVVGPFSNRTVEEVDVNDHSVLDGGDRPLGVTVRWTDAARTGYRIDAQVTVMR